MLRNEYLHKYKDKSKYEYENKYANDDDNLLLKSYRPISNVLISSLQSTKLQNFVDDLLTNKRVSQVLYSTNAKSEIDKYIKSNQVMELNSVKIRKKSVHSHPSDFVKNRHKKEAIGQIKGEVENFKRNKSRDKKQFETECKEFYKLIKDQQKDQVQEYFKPMNDNRIKRFEKIFTNIKLKLEKNHTPNMTETSHCFSQSNRSSARHEKKITLPDIKLDLKNVYSRLYHNAVYLNTAENENSKNKKQRNKNGPLYLQTDINQMTIQANPNNKKTANLKVKNVIESANGKEFTIKVTDEIFTKCFNRHSGGPVFKIEKVFIISNILDFIYTKFYRY
jgi:hypothetical protein